uniref:Dynamin N-terminal domain-containing protein n=1 Tax=Amphiprion ocellaris TaxID=80972 RepID=A0AAQ5YEP7_AMPOC
MTKDQPLQGLLQVQVHVEDLLHNPAQLICAGFHEPEADAIWTHDLPDLQPAQFSSPGMLIGTSWGSGAECCLTKIHDLETDKRELIGVFGKTGAGKSSLINAILGEEDLLPTGEITACTSVMIKVEANIRNSKYEADIEFIEPEDWRDEMWSMLEFHGNSRDQEQEDDKDGDDDDDNNGYDYGDNDDSNDYNEPGDDEKLSALYGEEWRDKTPENLIENKYFREIPEFLQSKKKTLTCESANELSAELIKYTRSEGEEITRCFWPLVKCVTVKVPNNDLLQHVTLVDLPGNGDRNKSRDKMWKEIVGDCSTVWIVTNINRAAAEKEAWEILTNTCSLMGNGGQCQQIHFICTHSDRIARSKDHSPAEVRGRILQRNEEAKKKVEENFSKQKQINKHFSDDCFKVFTVSSTEFLEEKHLNPEDTEIPQLQEFLMDLNDCHSVTLNYVSGAHGILSLMHGANSTEGVGNKAEVCRDLEENMKRELSKVRKPMEEAYDKFEKRLKAGVQKSKTSCDITLKSILKPRGVSGSAFHKTLKSLVETGGIYKPKKKKEININMKLASYLTNSIDEEFRKTFPNDVKRGPISRVIDTFSLDTDELTQKYKDVGLQLNFLKTEEEKNRSKHNKIIRERKKTIYNSLTGKIQKIMQDCYRKAAEFRGKGSLKKMRNTIAEHVQVSKDKMFEEAKAAMLKLLNDLKEEILKTLQETLEESTELSLKTDDNSIPDVPTELEMVRRYYDELKDNPDGETSQLE